MMVCCTVTYYSHIHMYSRTLIILIPIIIFYKVSNKMECLCNIQTCQDNSITLQWIIKVYRKQGKICWTKLSCFSWFSGVPRKFFCEYKCLSLFILNNEYLWPRQRKNISAKTLMLLKPRIFSPANLSPFTVYAGQLQYHWLPTQLINWYMAIIIM